MTTPSETPAAVKPLPEGPPPALALAVPPRPTPAGPPDPSVALPAPALPPPLLVDAREAARLLGIGKSLFFALKSTGRLPAPVHLGRRVLWHRETLIAWCKAGCPSAERFSALTWGGRR